MKMKLKYNDRGFARSMRKVNEEVDRMIDREIKVAGRDTSKMTKSGAPVKSTTLKSEIRTETKPKESAVIVDVDYAAYQDFGTGSEVSVPSELQEYAMQFKGAGIRQVNIKPRPYFYPAFFLNRKRLNDRTDKNMVSIFRKNSRR